MPRVECADCKRSIAARMVAGRPSKGRLWRHDPPERRSLYGSSLVSCPGSLAIVDLPLPAQQLELADPEGPDTVGIDTMPLF